MIRFGVAGYPPAFHNSPFKKNRLRIFEWIKGLGLDAFEAQMTYGPRTSKETCLDIKHASSDFDIKLSIHASYFIVFTSNDEKKIEQSIDTLKRTFELADIINSDVIVLHPGSLYGEKSMEIMNRIKENLHRFFKAIGYSDIGLYLETAGKKGQLGSVEEVFELSESVKGCHPCVDFGHVHARTGGSLKKPNGIYELFEKMKSIGAFNRNKKIHFHYTPIHFGPKGEITHKALADKIEKPVQSNLFTAFEELEDDKYHPRFESIVDNFLSIDSEFTIISEAHNSQEIAAMAMSSHYKGINLFHG